jgi:hypothetical protein
MSKLIGQPFVDIIQNNLRLVVDYVTQQINANTASDSIAKINVFYDSLSYVKFFQFTNFTLFKATDGIF